MTDASLKARAESYARLMLDRYANLPVFAISSWGCAATVWLARALNLHPSISCMDGLRGQLMSALALPDWAAVDYLRAVRAHAAPYPLAGDVHSITPSEIPALVAHFGDRIRTCVVVRDPRPRINSFMGLAKEFGYDKNWCDPSYLTDLPCQ